MTKEELIARVLRAHRTLGRERDLSPHNPEVNATLSALVRGVMDGCPPGDVNEVLDHPEVRAVKGELLARLAIAEGEMERCWGEMFCARSRLSIAGFEDFIYWDCYRRLVGAELRSLPPDLALGEGQSIAFVGAGPLPLSAIVLHVRTGMRVTCIDVDPRACSIACELCRKAGLTAIDVACAGGARYDYANNPVVFVASLVPEKGEVIGRIQEKCPYALVALRSAEGLCRLLYDPVDEEELAAMGCRFLGRTPYSPRVINTTLFYEAAPALRKERYAGRGAATRRPRPVPGLLRAQAAAPTARPPH